MKGSMKKAAILLSLCLCMGCATGCGNQANGNVSESKVTNVTVEGAGCTVDVSAGTTGSVFDFGFMKDGDGFSMAVKSGKVTGEIISDLQYNNLMATYYNTDEFNTISVNDKGGFAYTSEGATTVEPDGEVAETESESTSAGPDESESVTIEDMNDQPKDSATVSSGMRYHVFCIDDAGSVYVKLGSAAGDDALYQAENVLEFKVIASGKVTTDDSSVADDTGTQADVDATTDDAVIDSDTGEDVVDADN